VLKLLFPLLDSLEVIHAANILHRDIKPDNIYIREDGTPVLIDFGSARTINSNRDPTNIVSPGFAPFEQYHSKGKQGPWTDLYSLAAVMYWLVSGVKPMDSLSRQKQDSMMPAMKTDHKGRFDGSLLEAIDWALNPEEAQRPQSVAEFRRHLQAAPGEERTVLRARPPGHLGELRNKRDRSPELHVVRPGRVVEGEGDKTMTMPVYAGLGSTSPWRKFADKVAKGAGQVSTRIREAMRETYIAFRESTYWWKLALATTGAASAGWAFGGAAWSIGLGLATSMLGGLVLVRMMHKSPDEEDAGESMSTAAIWSRQSARPILLAVAPSTLIVALLWAVVPSGIPTTEPVAVAEAPQLANDNPNVAASALKPPSLRHDAEARANLKKAKKLLEEKNYADAIKLAKAVLKKYPRSGLARSILKEAKEGQKKPQGLFW
jgi:hypothetical protein